MEQNRHRSGTRPELKERAARMARDAIAEQGGEPFGVVTRIARRCGRNQPWESGHGLVS